MHEHILGVLDAPFQEVKKYKILLVDDEPRFRSAYKQLLGKENRLIDEAGNGQEALKKLKHDSIDLMILDLSLPDISGIDILEWMAINDVNVTVIVFSANKSINSAISALRRRVFDFLRKDCDPDDMCLAVDRALNQRALEIEQKNISKKLEQSEKLHRFLVEKSPDIIFNLDAEGFFRFINPRVKALLGYESDALIGQHYSSIVDPRDLRLAQYAFNECEAIEQSSTRQEIKFQFHPAFQNSRKQRHMTGVLSTQAVYEMRLNSLGPVKVGVSGVIRDVSDRKRAEETIAFQAFHDALTQLPNRNLFNDRLAVGINQASRRKEKLALLFFDLDRFKLVNDTYGHAVGDQLLKELSARIRYCLRNGDTLARQGGDEFTALLPSITDSTDVYVIAEKIMHALRQPFQVADTQFLATVSMGIAVYPDHASTGAELLRCADMAMYQVKGQGKNGYAVFLPHMRASEFNKISIEHDLREAVKSGEQFELYLQPQMDTETHQVIGLEVLLRWHHPKGGMISPDIFIPIAEETGLIVAISDWVLWKSCVIFDMLRNMGHGHIKLGVNLSPREFERSDFLDRIKLPLKKYEIHPASLDIEITESLLMKDVENIVERVKNMRDNGFHISIDDFGTRYSSLNYLRRFSVNRIKIDQSFVRDLGISKDSYAIIQAIVGIAKNFKLQVMAEGVETELQLNILRQLGCYEMQGYLFSKPLPLQQAIEFLKSKSVPVNLAC